MSEKNKPNQEVNEATAVCSEELVDVGEKKEALDENFLEKVQASEKSQEERLQEELLETKDRFLRLAADFENYKKIVQREQANSVRFANESLITSLLPIMDNLEQAIISQKKSGDSNNDILIGVEMVLKQLTEALVKFGVEIVSAKGLPFNPAQAEALCELEDDSVPPGTVVTEYQKAYFLHGRLLRAARVAVAKKSGNT